MNLHEKHKIKTALLGIRKFWKLIQDDQIKQGISHHIKKLEESINDSKCDSLGNRIKRHEGLRLKPYGDIKGNITIGYGRNLDGKGINREEAEILFENDVQDSINQLKNIFPSSCELDETRFGVLIEMMFNLGPKGFASFKKMRKAIRENDFKQAAKEMLDSKWADQVGDRAKILADIMEKGENNGMDT